MPTISYLIKEILYYIFCSMIVHWRLPKYSRDMFRFCLLRNIEINEKPFKIFSSFKNGILKSCVCVCRYRK